MVISIAAETPTVNILAPTSGLHCWYPWNDSCTRSTM